MVGASGAIFGLLGALWADLLQNWSLRSRRWCTLITLTIVTGVRNLPASLHSSLRTSHRRTTLTCGLWLVSAHALHQMYDFLLCCCGQQDCATKADYQHVHAADL
jgi:Rhomboid family